MTRPNQWCVVYDATHEGGDVFVFGPYRSPSRADEVRADALSALHALDASTVTVVPMMAYDRADSFGAGDRVTSARHPGLAGEVVRRNGGTIVVAWDAGGESYVVARNLRMAS